MKTRLIVLAMVLGLTATRESRANPTSKDHSKFEQDCVALAPKEDPKIVVQVVTFLTERNEAPDGTDQPDAAVDSTSGEEEISLKSEVTVRAVSPDGRLHAVYYRDGWDEVISIHEAKTGKELRKIVGHGDDVRALSFTADGRQLGSSSVDKGFALLGRVHGKAPDAAARGESDRPVAWRSGCLRVPPQRHDSRMAGMKSE